MKTFSRFLTTNYRIKYILIFSFHAIIKMDFMLDSCAWGHVSFCLTSKNSNVVHKMSYLFPLFETNNWYEQKQEKSMHERPWIWTWTHCCKAGDIARGSLPIVRKYIRKFYRRKAFWQINLFRHVNFDAPMFLIDRSKNNTAFHI